MIQPSFRAVVMEALRYFAEHGYKSESDLTQWLLRLHAVLERELPTDRYFKAQLGAALGRVFNREVKSGIQKRVPGVSRYTLDRIAPHLRAELDRRIFAGIDLIKLNRQAAVAKTLQRFSGFISSVPPSGMTTTNFREVVKEIIKPVADIRYEARRCAIDQAAKLSSSVSHVAAMQSGAIGAVWFDRGQFDKGYQARPEHLKRSGHLYLVRDSWAADQGFMKRGGPYTDDVTQPAEEVFCSCWWQWITSPKELPLESLTAKGRLQFGRP